MARRNQSVIEPASAGRQFAQSIVVIAGNRGPNVLVRLLWFVFVGWWVGMIATGIGYVLCLTVVGLPPGLLLLNRLPGIMTLRPPSATTQVSMVGGNLSINTGVRARQLPLLIRAIYFVCIGSWLTFLCLTLAWSLMAIWPITLGLSIVPAILLFDRVPLVLTLRMN